MFRSVRFQDSLSVIKQIHNGVGRYIDQALSDLILNSRRIMTSALQLEYLTLSTVLHQPSTSEAGQRQ